VEPNRLACWGCSPCCSALLGVEGGGGIQCALPGNWQTHGVRALHLPLSFLLATRQPALGWGSRSAPSPLKRAPEGARQESGGARQQAGSGSPSWQPVLPIAALCLSLRGLWVPPRAKTTDCHPPPQTRHPNHRGLHRTATATAAMLGHVWQIRETRMPKER
jgi:hypothetical protein